MNTLILAALTIAAGALVIYGGVRWFGDLFDDWLDRHVLRGLDLDLTDEEES
jgi:hypothetical protein